MKIYGMDLAEGSEITNITVPSGITFPTNDNIGELFYKTDEDKLYVRNNSTWIALLVGTASNADTLENQSGSYYLNSANHTGTLNGGSF